MADSKLTEAQLDEKLRKMFMKAVEKCAGKELPQKEKCICKTNAVKKMLTESFPEKKAKKMMNIVDSIVFPKISQKPAKTITIDQFITDVLPAAAKEGGMELYPMKEALCKKYDEWEAPSKGKDTGVVGRLTDASGYTGSHKERFDAHGQGKGKEGRCDVVDNSGYVGAYKEAGTYDKKH